MNAIETTVRNRRIDVAAPANWPDGAKVLVDLTPVATEKIAAEESEQRPSEVAFMSEDEQSDDPDAVERWIEELNRLPAVALTPAEEADLIAWRKKAKEFNLEAMRRQIMENVP